jgi:hypothetical protein
MKKLNLILFMTFAFVISSLTLVACKPQNPNTPQTSTPTTTTITLAEAKTTIINSLALDETQPQIIAVALSDQPTTNVGNRNLLEKLGKIELSLNTISKSYPNNEVTLQTTINGQYEYFHGDFTQYTMSFTDSTEGTLYEYSSDYKTAFVKSGTSITNHTITKGALGYSDTAGGMMIQMFNALFTDKAFEVSYEDTVTKNTKESGFELVLTLSLKGYSRLLTIDSMSDAEFETYWQTTQAYFDNMPQELKDYQSFTLSINFDNDSNILDTTLTCNSGSFMDMNGNIKYYKTESQLKIAKYNNEITQPQWVTEYIASQA